MDFYEYRENLDENIANLVKRLKQKNYRAKLVRRQYIPKINGKLRPLRIPATDDKVLQYALDLWFEKRIKRECNREALIIRYADDFVCAFQYKQDAELFYQQLNERLGKFALEVSPEKTRILLFSRSMLKQSETFDFLGFEFRRAIRRNFKPIIRRRTSRKKLRASIGTFTEWIKTKRNKKISGVIYLTSYWREIKNNPYATLLITHRSIHYGLFFLYTIYFIVGS